MYNVYRKCSIIITFIIDFIDYIFGFCIINVNERIYNDYI